MSTKLCQLLSGICWGLGSILFFVLIFSALLNASWVWIFASGFGMMFSFAWAVAIMKKTCTKE